MKHGTKWQGSIKALLKLSLTRQNSGEQRCKRYKIWKDMPAYHDNKSKTITVTFVTFYPYCSGQSARQRRTKSKRETFRIWVSPKPTIFIQQCSD